MHRRLILETAANAAILTALGATTMRDAAVAVATERRTVFGPLRQIDAGDLRVGYVDIGEPTDPAVILLHGWPYDIHSFAESAPALASKGFRVLVPYVRGFGTTRFLSTSTVRNGQQAALAVDVIALMDALRIETAILAGFDWGARTANVIAALWPQRCKAMVSASGYLIGSRDANRIPLAPEADLGWWYQFYFATERGRDGYAANRRAFAHLIWRMASPKWRFDTATFERSADALDNPDHVAIVIHNYRWRISVAPAEARYEDLEARLAATPTIAVPTITMEGDANGAPHPPDLRPQVRRALRTSLDRRRYRPQSSSGSSTGIRRRDRSCRPLLICCSWQSDTTYRVGAQK